ncbi:hypothetical protein PIB30_020367 [Stylosanthes scabra]|uniref:Uncharacterized protein n=1 Tax=Stylosanthes scabra TaxID=79078 RepID=A0ABU6Q8K2_9FABA|nr:hypothetical protein [Stylosanthes scabra]
MVVVETRLKGRPPKSVNVVSSRSARYDVKLALTLDKNGGSSRLSGVYPMLGMVVRPARFKKDLEQLDKDSLLHLLLQPHQPVVPRQRDRSPRAVDKAPV